MRPISHLSILFSILTSAVHAQWTLVQNGTTGVSAMQLSIVSPSLAIVIDKAEHNAVTINKHPAWGSLYNLLTNKATPLNIVGYDENGEGGE